MKTCVWCGSLIESDRGGYWYSTDSADETPWYCERGLPIQNAHRPES